MVGEGTSHKTQKMLRAMNDVISEATLLLIESAALVEELPQEPAVSLSWSHYPDCPALKNQAGRCKCNQGIMSEAHLNYFESSLRSETRIDQIQSRNQ